MCGLILADARIMTYDLVAAVSLNVIVTISSDCGGINSTSVKISRAHSSQDHQLCIQSVVSFLPTTATVLSPEFVERESEAGGKIGDLDSYYEIEGGETKSEVFQNLAEFQFSCVMLNAVLENACSEQGARMSAMDSSSRNAGDMLDRLTLTYNRTRQASITTELIQIISGASALEG
ncbi:putative H(+)-transporting two-sector ATPase [Helianthus debilis subsp. tardiflorus]